MTMNCDLLGDNHGLDQPSAKLTGNPSNSIGEQAVTAALKGGQRCQKFESA